jgi:hypothetical protein
VAPKFQVYNNQLLLEQTPSPRTYPNNTLVEDLSKCHHNLWPKAARATSKTIQLIKSCLPTAAPAPTATATTTTTTAIAATAAAAAAIESQTTSDNQKVAKAAQQNGHTIGFGKHLEGRRLSVSVISGGGGHRLDSVDGGGGTGARPKKPTANKKNKLTPKRRVRRAYKFPMPASILRLNSTVSIGFLYDNASDGALNSELVCRFVRLILHIYRNIELRDGSEDEKSMHTTHERPC